MDINANIYQQVFVTSAYRQKMEERALLEAEERNQERVEQLLDVRKAKDLSGFYANILKMKTGEFVVEEEGAKDKRYYRILIHTFEKNNSNMND